MTTKLRSSPNALEAAERTDETRSIDDHSNERFPRTVPARLGDVLYAERTLVQTPPNLAEEASDEELAFASRSTSRRLGST